MKVWLLLGLGLWMSVAMSQAEDRLEWTELPPLPTELGVAGPYTGVHQGHLIVAGGANFPEPVWENDKVWHDTIYALSLEEEGSSWVEAGTLPCPLGYGACVSIPDGVVCLGGNDAEQVYADAFLLSWDGESVVIEDFPDLPEPLVYSASAVLGNFIYVAGGTTEQGLDSAQKNFWRVNWAEGGAWEKLDPWPGEERAFASLVLQNNGTRDCLYLIGGRHLNPVGETTFLREVYRYDPARTENPWKRCADLPVPLAAGTAAAVGQSHILTLSGADGSLFTQSDVLKDDHPGFPKTIHAYHTITDTWVEAGTMPSNQVTIHAVKVGDSIYLASGEVRPRVRTKQVWQITPKRGESTFAAGNWAAILLYLGAVMGIGVFFSQRNRSTEDFFRGGQRVPGWVAGLSIFATLLSSITFVAFPAKAFATDWTFMLINAGILICAPLVAFRILPIYRKINATSAYEYLEQRFNLPIRLFASASFILFQLGRMAIVMYLPALALAAVTPLPLSLCILIMGGMSILYCTLGGLEAVVWTDALQAVVLLGGALLSLLLVIGGLDGGLGELTSVAAADGKLRWVEWDWSADSYMLSSVFWVILLGGIGSSLIPYSSDQAVVQRYVSTPSQSKAQSAVWINAGMAAVATLLFFTLGTALYVYYKAQPAALDPSFKTDAIFPLFIARELPIGVAGIVIAAIFAAAQSTVSSSMNSTATAIVTDWVRRLGSGDAPEASYLRLARILTIALGSAGTLAALILDWWDVTSAWQAFLTIIGFVMGPLCGIFLLGMFVPKANGKGAMIGAAVGVIAVVFAKYGTPMSGLLYAPVGIMAALGSGWIGSLLVREIASKATPP